MIDVISEKTVSQNDGTTLFIQEMSDGSTHEIKKYGSQVYETKIIRKDGSYIILNDCNTKTEEYTADGYLRKYNPNTQIIKEEISPQKVVTKFNCSGNILSVSDDIKGIYLRYYPSGQLASREGRGYELNFDVNGRVNYELKDGKVTINPDYFSYYRLGMRSKNNPEHWDEKCTLDPKKKTLLILGGVLTREAHLANGYSKFFLNILGLSSQEDNIQLVSCYRPLDTSLKYVWRKIQSNGLKEQIESDYKREILQKFMPFMAQKVDGKFERYTNEELERNFRNIMIQTHCYGAEDLPYFNKIFEDTMTKLGYSARTQKNALKQIICVTNNSQCDLTDKLGFNTIHRYSTKDGQYNAKYEKEYSAEYPVFIQDHKAFADQKGNVVAFIEKKPNEMIMFFDKILKETYSDDEHNEAFLSSDEIIFTKVGKDQARLMIKIGKFWYNNHEQIPNVSDLIKKITEKTPLYAFCKKAFIFGKKLKSEKGSALFNHHIIDCAWNRYKGPNINISKTGVYKLLSDKYKE